MDTWQRTETSYPGYRHLDFGRQLENWEGKERAGDAGQVLAAEEGGLLSFPFCLGMEGTKLSLLQWASGISVWTEELSSRRPKSHRRDETGEDGIAANFLTQLKSRKYQWTLRKLTHVASKSLPEGKLKGILEAQCLGLFKSQLNPSRAARSPPFPVSPSSACLRP